MTEAEIQQAIGAALRNIAPEADLAKVRPEENLREALDIDSFDFLNLLIGVHERLGVEVPEAGYGQVATLSGMIRYLALRLPGAALKRDQEVLPGSCRDPRANPR